MERRPHHFVEVALSHSLYSRSVVLVLSSAAVGVGVGAVGSVSDPRWPAGVDPGHASPTASVGRNSDD